MEFTATRAVLAPARRLGPAIDRHAVAVWTLAFGIVFYLALRGGGYDTVVRSEIDVALWWLVLLGALVGILPARIGAAGWVAVALLGAFAVWTGLATTWSESAERSAIELGRVATYAGVLLLALALQGRTTARHMLAGLTCAVGLVTVLAVLSRLHPQWFPANEHLAFLGPASARKLSYPLNYWNALAAFAAIGVPLLLTLAIGARTLAGQAIAAAVLPISGLCLYLTISRGGLLALCAALAVFLLLAPRRIDALATLVVAAAGAAILVSAASQRPDLLDGLGGPAALQQGDELLWLALIVCLGVALVQVALGLTARHVERPALLSADRRTTARRALVALGVVVVAGVAAGAPGQVQRDWRDFKAPPGVVAPASDATVFSRLEATNGNGRYEFWRAATEAAESRPWTGTGPGTFEFWWARHATTDGFVRDAHMLYLETLAETGLVGFALLLGFFAWLLAIAGRRLLRAPAQLRLQLAGATAALVGFLSAAALEWVWEMAAIGVTAMLLAATILAGRADDEPPTGGPGPMARAGVAVLAVVALIAILVPLAGTLATRESRAAAAAGDLTAALADTSTAERVQPFAATPHLQRALILETDGALAAAASAARAAIAAEPTNWRPWLVLARIDARRNRTDAALASMRRARDLNPRSPLFTEP